MMPNELHEPKTISLEPALHSGMLRNFRHLYFDIFWYGIFVGSTLGFLSVYMARLGGLSLQLALLTIGPAVANLLLSLPFGRWLERRGVIKVTYWSAFVQRFALLILVPLPLIFSEPAQINFLILLMFAVSVPGTILAISFNAMFAQLVPREQRARVVGRRNGLLAISATISSLASGALLDGILFPLNYQIVFAIGALGAGFSSYHLGKLRDISTVSAQGIPDQALHDHSRPGLFNNLGPIARHAIGLRFLMRSSGRPLLRLDLLRGPFGSFMGAYLFFYATQYIAVPLLPLLLVQEIGLSDGIISLGNALFYVVMLIVSLQLDRVSRRFGERRLLVGGALLFGLYPLLHALATDAGLILLSLLLHGAIWAITGGSLVNRLMARVPEDDRPAHMALHNLVLNLGILLGSLAAPLLAHSLGIRQALILCALLRVGAGLLMARWG